VTCHLRFTSACQVASDRLEVDTHYHRNSSNRYLASKNAISAEKERGEILAVQILVVDDSPVYRQLITSHLQDWGFPFTIAKGGSEAWAVLQRPDSPKLVLLDWVLPDIDGVELCRRIREASTGNSYSYIILLTGKDGKKDMLEAMQAGADDYLVKPFDQLELKARLLVGQRIVKLHEELVTARESMRYAATRDSLTGLLNRGETLDFLSRESERTRRSGKPLSLLLADVDRFKNVNDTLGHLYGDEALKEVARRFRSKLRVYDGVGRYGGEEFLMILADCDLMTALIRADDLRLCVASKPIVSARASSTITVSIGVGVSKDHSDGDIEALLNQADRGLYAAKQKGRNRVEHVDEVQPVVATKRRSKCAK
jgi:two-component system cell cycle response regulator